MTNRELLSASLLVIDKHPGPTSFDIVREVKKALPVSKVGHAGSLDPFASGVLVILLGKATRLSIALLNADKKYRAIIELGVATDTMDRTGTVTRKMPVANFTADEILRVLESYKGEWLQTPPMFSAKKFRGVRLYELARKKINVRMAPIPVQLYSIKLWAYDPPRIDFEVHCSKGTYIRSLADDIGRRLGTAGHLNALQRLSCGDFTLADSLSLEEFKKDPVKAVEKGYQHYLRLLRSEGVVRYAQNSVHTSAKVDGRRVDDYAASRDGAI